MVKLEKLYSIIENSREVGVRLNKDVLQQVEELEKGIIKEEILPALSNDIAPRLEAIKRDLVLVVEYHPGEPISVSLSRKANIKELLGAKTLELDPEVEHREGPKRKMPIGKISDKTILRVTFSDGKVIAESKAKYTYVETIRRIGLMRVRNLGIKFCGVPIVSTTIDKKYGYAQVPVENGLYILTHSSTKDKKIQLDRIATELGLKLKVEII